jgi:hypothetical protein
LKVLGGLIDEMDRRARKKYPEHDFDLAIVPESVVNPTVGPASSRAIPLKGPGSETFSALARKGAELVAWPGASPATARPATRAARHRYYAMSSIWREGATVFEPTGLVAAQVKGRQEVLVHQLDPSFAVLGWSPRLRNGEALTEKFGYGIGYHYEPREDLSLRR